MREHYDFSNSARNPYAARLYKQGSVKVNIAVDINDDLVDYFPDLTNEKNITFEQVINVCLQDFVDSHRKI